MDAQAVCIGIDADQHHVVNHLTGEEMPQTRNMLVEAARIARGDIQKIENIVPADIDALVDTQARRAFTEAVVAFDRAGHDIWRRLLQHLPARGKPSKDAHDPKRHTTH